VIGALNDFHFSPVLHTLKQGVLIGLMDTWLAGKCYIYDFEGNDQSLDPILANHKRIDMAEYNVVHVNAEDGQECTPAITPRV
jgi:predicted extracellular nuclease